MCKNVGQRNGLKLASMASKMSMPIHRIKARYTGLKSSKKKSSQEFNGLRRVIHLAVGCKVVITRNVSYLYGLANGARGKVVGFVYTKDAKLDTLPEAIVVEVPDYTGPAFYPSEPKWVPILTMEDWAKSTNSTRIQFPLVAGFAITINKSQGLTIKEGVVIDLRGDSKKLDPV